MNHVVAAEIVANVLAVLVEVGQEVPADTAVVMLESMKMEIPVLSEVSGVVAEILVQPGDVVHEGEDLVVLEVSQ